MKAKTDLQYAVLAADPMSGFVKAVAQIYPDKKIGIVCEKVNEKGVLRVQIKSKKIWINRKRVKLHVAASELYPEDYDFSIIFETVENRKIKHDMSRKYTEATIVYDEE